MDDNVTYGPSRDGFTPNGLSGMFKHGKQLLNRTEYSPNEFWASAEYDVECNPPTARGQTYIPTRACQTRTTGLYCNPWSINSATLSNQRYITMGSAYPPRTSSRERNRMNFRRVNPSQSYPRNYATYNTNNASTWYNYYQDFPEKEKKQCQPDFKLSETRPKNEQALQNTIKKQIRHPAPLPLWTPECHPDPETGEMHSIPGAAQIYSNGHAYPTTQLYVDTQVARNMPANRHLWDPNEVQLQPQPSPQQEMKARQFTDFEESSYIPQFTTRHRDNEYNWPSVYEIYGTAIGIILKCMLKEITIQGIPTTDVFRQDKWLQEQGLPYPTTRWILDRYYYQDTFFYQVGERVTLGVRKRRELKDKIKVGVEAGMWPGDTDFSELRNTCEILRKKALEFLERWGDLFEKEWVAMRQRRDY